MTLTLEPRERHAVERAKERYGVNLTDDLKHEIIRAAKRTRRRMGAPAKDSKRVFYTALTGLPAQPAGALDRKGRRIWRYDDGEIRIRCVIDEREWALVTVLPWEAVGRASRE